jgi:hypothetical protein
MRTEEQIFEDLATLCISPGFIHVISFFSMRDNTIIFGEEMKPDDLSHFYTNSHISRTEANVLLGLLIKSDIDYSIPIPEVFQELTDRAEALMEEMHTAVSGDFFDTIKPGMKHNLLDKRLKS